jgi:REP element-mobilizing transposase RayT
MTMPKKYWYEIPQHFPFVKLGEFVVMSNQIHGIIIIDKTNNYTNMNATIVETQNFASLQPPEQQYLSTIDKSINNLQLTIENSQLFKKGLLQKNVCVKWNKYA